MTTRNSPPRPRPPAANPRPEESPFSYPHLERGEENEKLRLLHLRLIALEARFGRQLEDFKAEVQQRLVQLNRQAKRFAIKYAIAAGVSGFMLGAAVVLLIMT